FGRSWHVHLGGCSGGLSLVSSASAHRRVPKVVEDLPQPGSAQLVEDLGECRGAGINPTRDLFMACFRLGKSRGSYYLTARVSFRVSGAPSNNKDRMDLSDLRGMLKMSSGKAPSTRAAAPAREVSVSLAREAPKTSSKRPIYAPIGQADDPAR
ncbi:hypothetical protein B296_00053428, partial [Ensete ventricosum]